MGSNSGSSKNKASISNKVTDADVKALVRRSQRSEYCVESGNKSELETELNDMETDSNIHTKNQNQLSKRVVASTNKFEPPRKIAATEPSSRALLSGSTQIEQSQSKRSMLTRFEKDFQRRKVLAPDGELLKKQLEPRAAHANDEPPRLLPSFVSASHELNRQTVMKASKENSAYQPKTLGMFSSRKSINPQFKPPTQHDTIKNIEAMEVDDEMTHPLLKNVDPKLLEIIKNEIVVHTKDVTWDDIAGLAEAKDIIQEVVVLPLLNPNLFQGLRSAPKGILLFGPPGKPHAY